MLLDNCNLYHFKVPEQLKTGRKMLRILTLLTLSLWGDLCSRNPKGPINPPPLFWIFLFNQAWVYMLRQSPEHFLFYGT